MCFKNKFLTLPIKIQICIAIAALNIFCLLVILSICGSLAYEILKEDIKQKKLYFYEKYQEYIESCFYFKNFCLLQYEEIVKTIQTQMRENLQVSLLFNYSNINMNIDNKFKIIEFDPRYDLEEDSNENDYLYYHCFYYYEDVCFYLQNKVMEQYIALSSLVSSHNINKKFNMPIFDKIAIIENPIFYEIYSYSMFSFDLSILLKKFKDIFGHKNDVNLIDSYLEVKLKEFLDEIIDILHLILIYPQPLIELIFNKSINKIREEMPDYKHSYENNDLLFFLEISNYFPKIDYGNNQFNLINEHGISLIYYYVESKIIDNYLYFMNNKLSSYIDIYFVPLYFGNNTIISPDLCILFLLKQVKFGITQKEVDELYDKIIKGESNINNCINNNELFKKQLEIDDIFNLNQSFYIFVSNSSISQGIVNLDNSNYYFMKYSYPNFNSFIEFKPEYFYKDQINFYLFSSFREPIKYSNLFYQVSSNSFYLIILIIVYIWAICLLISLFIYNKVIIQIISPINNLQQTLLSNSIKDKNIFEYEYDEFINDLFLTCKELLTKQIDSKEKVIDNLNHNLISKEKIKDSEESKYAKNLRINNDIMNKLMNRQKSLMDFSKYIETNENNYLENYLDKNNKSSLSIKKVNFDNIGDNDNNNKVKFDNNIQNKNSFKFEKEEKEKENRESFKKLFQISEYFYYFLDNNKRNLINISDNEINSEIKINPKNEKFSKRNLEQVNSNYHKTIKKSDSINRDNTKSFDINMIDKNEITYLWYMEAKKKKNKSLNYKMGNQYEELFKDKV